MPEQAINIRITLKDEISNNLKKVSSQVKDLGLQMRQVGREMSYVGMSMTAWGTAITAPLILAYKEAGKYNAEIAKQLNETKYTFQNLAITIGTSLLPIMKTLTDEVSKAVDWWNNLDGAVRDRLIQNIFKLGAGLIALGTAFIILGKSVTFLANITLLTSKLLTLNPVVLAVGLSFTILAVAMWKCKEVADGVLNSLQAIARLSPILNLARLFGGKTPEQFFGKQGDWAKGFNDFKNEIKELGDVFSTFGKSVGGKSEGEGGTLWSGFILGLEQAKEALGDFRDWGMQAGQDLATSLQDSFKTVFTDMFSGQLKKAKDYFADFGKSILNIFANMLAQMVAKWAIMQAMTAGSKVGSWLGILSSVVGGVSGAYAGSSSGFSFGGGSSGGSGASGGYHKGGIIYAHGGLNLASDEIPIIAQTGERVLSRSQNKAYENKNSQTPAVVFIQAWDTQDIMRNKKSIEGIIINAMRNNSSVRGTIKSYS